MTAEPARPLSRGRQVAGRRRVQRWVNDNLVPSLGLLRGGLLSEEELAERLEHLYIRVEHRSFLEPLASHRELLREFRRGHVSLESLRLREAALRHEASRGHPAAGGGTSVRHQLEAMYKRIDRRCRPLLLERARTTLARYDAGNVYLESSALLTDLEALFQRLCDGTLPADLPRLNAKIAAVQATAAAGEGGRTGRAHTAEAPVKDAETDGTAPATDPAAAPTTAAGQPAQQPAYEFGDDMAHAFSGPIVHAVLDTGRGTAQRSLLLPFVDGFTRLLALGLAEFYGLPVRVIDSALAAAGSGASTAPAPAAAPPGPRGAKARAAAAAAAAAAPRYLRVSAPAVPAPVPLFAAAGGACARHAGSGSASTAVAAAAGRTAAPGADGEEEVPLHPHALSTAMRCQLAAMSSLFTAADAAAAPGYAPRQGEAGRHGESGSGSPFPRGRRLPTRSPSPAVFALPATRREARALQQKVADAAANAETPAPPAEAEVAHDTVVAAILLAPARGSSPVAAAAVAAAHEGSVPAPIAAAPPAAPAMTAAGTASAPASTCSTLSHAPRSGIDGVVIDAAGASRPSSSGPRARSAIPACTCAAPIVPLFLVFVRSLR